MIWLIVYGLLVGFLGLITLAVLVNEKATSGQKTIAVILNGTLLIALLHAEGMF